jgi:sigma-54 dependent transcriptional regulator, acetoin dehydrogenase operon transcriptional activator AcoR
MSRSLTSRPRLASGDRLAANRERFLTAEPVEPNQVRDTILASWWRSKDWKVAADRIELSYVRDPDLDTPLTRTALPVLRQLRESLEGQPISVILTDANGVVLSRMAADHDLDRHLDSVKLAPGFSYAEESVGTNGIGTALEIGRPAHVFGHEHYAEKLEDLACAGVPIHHPISGKTVGAVDLTCWRKDADPLLIALAKTTANQITRALFAAGSAPELELLQEYLRTCRHAGGMVIALNNEMVMMNEHARQTLDPTDQVVLLGQATDALANRVSGIVVIELPSGAKARLQCKPVRGTGHPGGVVQVKLIEQLELPRSAEVPAQSASRMILPGLVGSGALWLRACHQVDGAYVASEWLAMQGEPGVGKLAVLRATHQRRNPAGRLRVLDAAEAADQQWLAEARRELLEGEGVLVIRHVEQLNARRMHAMSAALQEAHALGRHRKLWVAVTLNHGKQSADVARLLRFFPSTVELPPLRHHIDDLHDLVPFFLGKLSQPGRLTCSFSAMQLLLRSTWPGNTEQLWQVMRRVVQHRRAGAIQPSDLPPECWTVSRRLLSPLESIERDAIVQALLDSGGNKLKAAKSLGMSRATIYRKVHEYGIVAPASLPARPLQD